MRLIFTYALTIALGLAVAAGAAWLVGLFSPWLRGWVFLAIAAWWIWMGWRYATLRDRERQRPGDSR